MSLLWDMKRDLRSEISKIPLKTRAVNASMGFSKIVYCFSLKKRDYLKSPRLKGVPSCWEVDDLMEKRVLGSTLKRRVRVKINSSMWIY